jgi:NAD(P)-dependent dehydrogenase (short-subunit alcohol dehydrogenase family)
MAQWICVTGASGQAGRAVVTDLRAHGYDVAATDVAVTRADREDGMLRADLTDYGQAVPTSTYALTRDVGEFGTLLAIDRARQVLGFEPAHSWRDHVPA